MHRESCDPCEGLAEALKFCAWFVLVWPLVLAMAFLWPMGLIIMQERPDIGFWESLRWSFFGFPDQGPVR